MIFFSFDARRDQLARLFLRDFVDHLEARFKQWKWCKTKGERYWATMVPYTVSIYLHHGDIYETSYRSVKAIAGETRFLLGIYAPPLDSPRIPILPERY